MVLLILADLPINGPMSRRWGRPSKPAERGLRSMQFSGHPSSSHVGAEGSAVDKHDGEGEGFDLWAVGWDPPRQILCAGLNTISMTVTRKMPPKAMAPGMAG